MTVPKALLLLLVLLLGSPASADSLSGSLTFVIDTDIEGEIFFTALDPGQTTSSFAPFSSYSQTATTDYTYLYIVDNNSAVGGGSGPGDEHTFFGVDLVTLLDPTGPGIHTIGYDLSNLGEEPSDVVFDPPPISYFFDDPPNYGILPDGGQSAILRFFSEFGPSSGGGAFITSNEFDGGAEEYKFAEITTGITTPVPEPGSAALLALGLLGLAGRRSRVR